MLRYKTQTRPGLVALYDIRTGNVVGQFLQPRSLHRARSTLDQHCWIPSHKKKCINFHQEKHNLQCKALTYYHRRRATNDETMETYCKTVSFGCPQTTWTVTWTIDFLIFIWHLWLGDRKGVRPVKNCVGLLVVTTWLKLCTSYSFICHQHHRQPWLQ